MISMMTKTQLDSFHQFATERLSRDNSALSWAEMFDLWQLENPTPEEQSEIREALDESLDDIRNGRTRPADQALQELRARHVEPSQF